MKKLADQIGGSSDTAELRQRLQDGRSVTQGLCKETTNLLKVCVVVV